MKTMTKVMMMVVFVFSILFQNGMVAKADTTPIKSGKDLYQLNVMAKKIDPVCKKYGYQARNSAEGFEFATCVDSKGNKVLQDITPIFVATNQNTKNYLLAVDVIVQLGSRDTRTNLIKAVAEAKKKLEYGVYTKGGGVVMVRKNGDINFMNYASIKIVDNTPKTNPFNLNTMAKTINPLCKKYSLVARNSGNSALCVDKKNVNFPLVTIANGTVTSSPTKIRNTVALTVDIAYTLGKKDTKAELLRVSKLAINTPHKYFKTKNGTPIVADKGGRVTIPYTKTAITKINNSFK